jgi:hypothetical protein
MARSLPLRAAPAFLSRSLIIVELLIALALIGTLWHTLVESDANTLVVTVALGFLIGGLEYVRRRL